MMYFQEGDQALFSGEEQEGPFQGSDTLFVVGEVNVEMIGDAMGRYFGAHDRDYGQLYLGAGFLSRCTPDYIRTIAAFVEANFGDGLMLTVEASYLDVKVLRECHRIDHWVYTAMMLGCVNPNYQQTMQLLTNKALQERMELRSDLLEKVSIKTDFAGTTIVCAAKDVAWSRYQDYGNDTLIWANNTLEDRKVPMPMTLTMSDDPNVTESINLWKMDVRAQSYQVTVGWSPKLIFRSNP